MNKKIVVTAAIVEKIYTELRSDNTYGLLNDTPVLEWFNQAENATPIEAELAIYLTDWMDSTEIERIADSDDWLRCVNWNENLDKNEIPSTGRDLSEEITARIEAELS